ncbi:CaiB/BaiF CoA-transferase family protein [Bradyrhizobium sp. CCGUVB14]|uniref:CaiB/BaiF CoA transferase family protein n=1 Tax=Bradyrhizobium sp. CCGUVB14 TaxID=2949628 RepID=UPI0020B27B78|nr:CoA transferase [Bradyrhizobium sp. CCGUVB14]MCP3440803.1 CoA transferase [Bradyrhizobium sp. CCGUVB14]
MKSSRNRSDLSNGPLAGYRVLDLGSTVAGPFCARLLADFGAEVVKVEDLAGDPLRNLGETFRGKSLYATTLLRNKRIISINLRSKDGQDIVRRLVSHFDIVVENFRPGMLEKWGLGYEDLRKVRPDLIMTRISGFGQTGPMSQRPGYGVIGEAMSGLREMIGDPDRPPSRVGLPLTDYITAMYAAFGTAMAVIARESTGEGQCVDAALYEAAFSLMEASVPAFEKTGKLPRRAGARLPNSAPNSLYPTRDGKFIHIAALADQVYRRLCKAMGRPELGADPRFAEQATRARHVEEIDAIVEAWTRSHDLDQVEAILDAEDVPASRIFTMEDIFASKHYRFREMILDVPDEDLGSVKLPGIVPKLSRTPGQVRWSGHRNGQDSQAILREYLNLDDAEIERLLSTGAVGADVLEAMA